MRAAITLCGSIAVMVALLGCSMCNDCQDYAPPVVNSALVGETVYDGENEMTVVRDRAVNDRAVGEPTEASRISRKNGTTIRR